MVSPFMCSRTIARPSLLWRAIQHHDMLWFSCHDSGSFEWYSDQNSDLLEGLFDAHQHRGGASAVTTPPIVRYVDDRPQCYTIDYRVRPNASWSLQRALLTAHDYSSTT